MFGVSPDLNCILSMGLPHSGVPNLTATLDRPDPARPYDINSNLSVSC